jgi:hypothetical protein
MVNYIECIELIEILVNREEIIEKIKDEVSQQLKMAKKKVHYHIEDHFPEITRAVQFKRGGYYLVNYMYKYVEEMVHRGQIEEKEAHYFTHYLKKSTRNLTLNKLKVDSQPPDKDIADHSQLFHILGEDSIQSI